MRANVLHMNGTQFVKLVRKLGRKRGVEVEFDARRGKGSHGTLYYGDHLTVIKDLKKEIRIGLLKSMLKRIGLTAEDLE